MGDDKSNNPPPEPSPPERPARRVEEPREIGLSEGQKGMQALPAGDPSGLVDQIEALPPVEPPPPPPPPPSPPPSDSE